MSGMCRESSWAPIDSGAMCCDGASVPMVTVLGSVSVTARATPGWSDKKVSSTLASSSAYKGTSCSGWVECGIAENQEIN